MIFRFFIFTTLVFTVSGCTQVDTHVDYSTSAALTFNLLEICVEKTLNAHSELNTKEYVLDLNNITTLNQDGIDSFIKVKTPLLAATHDDSVLVLQNTDWKRSQVLQNIILKIIEVEYHDKENVTVKLSKMRARNQTIKITLDLARQGNIYKVVKSEVRR
ncbi:MAG: hypothetical protein ABIT58_04940 [Ferruginibacter sp.]